MSNLSPVTWQVGGPLIKEKAGLSIEVDECDEHSCFLLHLQPSHKVGRPLNTHAVSCLIVSRQKYISSISSWSTTGPSAGLRGFILAILARQRARDSCEVRSAVRKGDNNEEGEVEKEEEEMEKAMWDDIDIEEELTVRAPSPIAAPTLCILKRLIIIWRVEQVLSYTQIHNCILGLNTGDSGMFYKCTSEHVVNKGLII